MVAGSCLTLTIGSSGAQTLTTVNDPAGSGGGLAPPQVALIGRRMLQTLAPTGMPTVTVFSTTWGRAETILLGGPRSEADRTAAELHHGSRSSAAAGPAGRPRAVGRDDLDPERREI